MQDFLEKNKMWVAAALVAFALLFPKLKEMDLGNIIPDFGGGGSVVEVENFESVPEPTAEYKSKASGIGDLIVGEDSARDKKMISQFYAQFSKIIENSDFLETTQQFRSYNVNAGKLNFSGVSLAGKYSGLAEKIDGVIINEIGKQNKKFDSSDKKNLSNILAAISWDIYHVEK